MEVIKAGVFIAGIAVAAFMYHALPHDPKVTRMAVAAIVVAVTLVLVALLHRLGRKPAAPAPAPQRQAYPFSTRNRGL